MKKLFKLENVEISDYGYPDLVTKTPSLTESDMLSTKEAFIRVPYINLPGDNIRKFSNAQQGIGYSEIILNATGSAIAGDVLVTQIQENYNGEKITREITLSMKGESSRIIIPLLRKNRNNDRLCFSRHDCVTYLINMPIGVTCSINFIPLQEE